MVSSVKVAPALGLLRKVGTAALASDALDEAGYPRQALGYDIVPIAGEGVLVGRAFTAQVEAMAAAPAERYAGLLRALDEVHHGEVFVAATERAERAAMWGELLSTACKAKGVAGVVSDGLVRDVAKIRAMTYPVFARGTLPYDVHPRLEVTKTGGTVVIDGVEIHPGDVVVADADGVVIVPAGALDAVVGRVVEKATGENRFRDAVAAGMAASEAYARFGVL